MRLPGELSICEAAERLGVDAGTVRRLAQAAIADRPSSIRARRDGRGRLWLDGASVRELAGGNGVVTPAAARKDWLSPAAAARLLEAHPRTVRRWAIDCLEGRTSRFRGARRTITGRIQIPTEEVRALQKQHEDAQLAARSGRRAAGGATLSAAMTKTQAVLVAMAMVVSAGCATRSSKRAPQPMVQAGGAGHVRADDRPRTVWSEGRRAAMAMGIGGGLSATGAAGAVASGIALGLIASDGGDVVAPAVALAIYGAVLGAGVAVFSVGASAWPDDAEWEAAIRALTPSAPLLPQAPPVTPASVPPAVDTSTAPP